MWALKAVESFSQGCKFSGNYLNSGFHEVQIPKLLCIFQLVLEAFSPDSQTFSGFFFLQVSLHSCSVYDLVSLSMKNDVS